MRSVQVSKAGGDLELVDRDIPSPQHGWVRVRVHACGICHGDSVVKMGHWPGLQFPRVPGHEVAGAIDELGDGVTLWKQGQRVGVGWYGGHCGVCAACRRGNLVDCRQGGITGITHDGGYAEYMLTPAASLVAVPDDLSLEDAAPLLCAGLTSYNALRHSGAMPGDLVAIQSIGGLGHLGIQFAAKFGYRTVAISRGEDSREISLQLGAHAFINSEATNPAEELQRLGGAKVILATAPSSKAMSALIDGLGDEGKMIVAGASPDPIQVSPIQLIAGKRSIQGWAAGTAKDSEDTLNFAILSGVRPMIEKIPLVEAAQAYERMMSAKARFRVVLTM